MRFSLITQSANDFGGRSDESNASLFNFTRKFGGFGEKTISRKIAK